MTWVRLLFHTTFASKVCVACAGIRSLSLKASPTWVTLLSGATSASKLSRVCVACAGGRGRHNRRVYASQAKQNASRGAGSSHRSTNTSALGCGGRRRGRGTIVLALDFREARLCARTSPLLGAYFGCEQRARIVSTVLCALAQRVLELSRFAKAARSAGSQHLAAFPAVLRATFAPALKGAIHAVLCVHFCGTFAF